MKLGSGFVVCHFQPDMGRNFDLLAVLKWNLGEPKQVGTIDYLFAQGNTMCNLISKDQSRDGVTRAL